MNLNCPRCDHDSLTLNLQVFATFSFTGGLRTSTSIDDDGEGFLSLVCDSCHLTLSGSPGDGRIRRSSLVDSDTGDGLPENDTNLALEARMAEIAEALSGVAAAV